MQETPPPKKRDITLEFTCDSGTHWTAGWVGTWTELGTLENRHLARTEIIIIIISSISIIIIIIIIISQGIKTFSLIYFVLWTKMHN